MNEVLVGRVERMVDLEIFCACGDRGSNGKVATEISCIAGALRCNCGAHALHFITFSCCPRMNL